MLIVGLTGGIATGKSTVSDILQKTHGLTVIDADLIARQVVEPGKPAYNKIVAHFGPNISGLALEDGTLNRPALGKYVFEHKEELHVLNSIVHPAVRWEIFRQIILAYCSLKQMVVLDVPLLFEAGLDKICGVTICVICTEELQIRRLLARNPELSEQDARNRINSQMSNSIRIRKADYLIENSSSLKVLDSKINGALDNVRPWWVVYVLELFPPFALISALGRFIIRRANDYLKSKDE